MPVSTTMATRADIRVFMISLLDCRNEDHVHRLLHVAIKKAVRAEVLARDVVSVFSPPKVEDDEIELLDAADVPVVLAKLAGHALGPVASTGLATVPREASRWRWPGRVSISMVVTIERSLEQTKKHGGMGCTLRFKRPKTKAGVRMPSLPASAVAVLRKHRQAQLEMRMQLGLGKPTGDAVVFFRPDG